MIPARVVDTVDAAGRALRPATEFGKGLFGVDDNSPGTAGNMPKAPLQPMQSAMAWPAQGQGGTASAPTAGPVSESRRRGQLLPDGVTMTQTGVQGISRLDGVAGAPKLFTDNPTRAIADAQRSAGAVNRNAQREAMDGRLNRDVIAAGFAPRSMRTDSGAAQGEMAPRGFQPRSAPTQMIRQLVDGRMVQVPAEDSLFGQPGFIEIGNSGDSRINPGNTRYNPLVAREFKREQAENRAQGNQQQEFALRSQQLADRRRESEVSVQLEQQRMADDREARGFQSRSAVRLERLQQQYEAASPEARQIRDLSGREQPNRFTVVPGGQEYDSGSNSVMTRPSQVLNNQTGQFVPQQVSAQPAQRTPPANRAVGMTSTVNGKTAVWDGSKWVPR